MLTDPETSLTSGKHQVSAQVPTQPAWLIRMFILAVISDQETTAHWCTKSSTPGLVFQVVSFAKASAVASRMEQLTFASLHTTAHTATQAENAHSLALVGVEHVGRDNSTGQVSTVIAVAECGFDNGLGRTGYCSVVPQAPPGAGPTTTFFAGATLLTATTTVATPTPTSTSRPNGSRDPPGLNPSSAGKRVVASSVLTAVVTAAPVVSLLAALLQ